MVNNASFLSAEIALMKVPKFREENKYEAKLAMGVTFFGLVILTGSYMLNWFSIFLVPLFVSVIVLIVWLVRQLVLDNLRQERDE